MAQTSGLVQQPYPDVGQLASPYEQQQPPGQELNQYATLKAVGEPPSSRRSNGGREARLCPPPPQNSKFL